MVLCKNKANLSPARRRLLGMLQQLNFGWIDNLVVKDGEPVFSPPPVITREVKFGGDNGPRRELGLDDFLLKSQVVELFAFFDDLQNGTIGTLEVKHGIPFRLVVKQAAG